MLGRSISPGRDRRDYRQGDSGPSTSRRSTADVFRNAQHIFVRSAGFIQWDSSPARFGFNLQRILATVPYYLSQGAIQSIVQVVTSSATTPVFPHQRCSRRRMAIFSQDGSGTGPAAAVLNEDGTLNSASQSRFQGLSNFDLLYGPRHGDAGSRRRLDQTKMGRLHPPDMWWFPWVAI